MMTIFDHLSLSLILAMTNELKSSINIPRICDVEQKKLLCDRTKICVDWSKLKLRKFQDFTQLLCILF